MNSRLFCGSATTNYYRHYLLLLPPPTLLPLLLLLLRFYCELRIEYLHSQNYSYVSRFPSTSVGVCTIIVYTVHTIRCVGTTGFRWKWIKCARTHERVITYNYIRSNYFYSISTHIHSSAQSNAFVGRKSYDFFFPDESPKSQNCFQNLVETQSTYSTNPYRWSIATTEMASRIRWGMPSSHGEWRAAMLYICRTTMKCRYILHSEIPGNHSIE